jgi:hypothetical protein
MSKVNKKPSGWLYVFALVLPFLACGIAAVPIYLSVPKLPGAFDDLSMNSLTQVVMPGSSEINFSEAGAYAVYYEYRSVIDGIRYNRGIYPPIMNCQLRSKATGENVRLAYPNAKGEMYSTGNNERVGVLMRTISIDQPGAYIFSCQYPDHSATPRIMLAVGPNFIWEFFNLAAKPAAAIVGGLIVFLGAGVISIIMVIIVAIKRSQSNNRTVRSI